jgi:hypothetical protein
MSKLTRTLLVPLAALCFAGLFTTSAAQAQSVGFGADVVNRYIWRGSDFGSAAAIQPGLSYSNGGFTIGSWGSYSLSPNASGSDELDLYASYAFETGSGTFSVGVTDYYFPGAGGDFFNYDSAEDGGRHTIEPNVSYSGPESFPISLYASVFAYGEFAAENSIWLEASYPFSVQDVDLSIAIGGTPSDEGGNFGVAGGDSDTGITKLSVSASKSVEITDEFSLPLMASYYVNPYVAQSFFVFGISL